MRGTNNLTISENEKLFLNGVELTKVEQYELRHSAGGTAELTVKLEVIVNPTASESKQ